MTISVRYFASVRENLGKEAEKLDLAGRTPSVAAIWESVGGGQRPERLLVAVNQEYVDWDHPVSDGDEVAFSPPVTGG